MRSLVVVVPRREAEDTRRRLREEGLLDPRFRVGRRGEDLLLPVRRAPAGRFAVEEAEVEARTTGPRTYRDVCPVPEPLRPLLPTSFDQIGDIVLLKLPEPLVPHAATIGRAILEVQRSAKVVAVDAGVKGEFRVREVRVVAGEERTETVHREHGLRFCVDVAKAYFSPRLGTERLRVASLVRPGETVVDLFSGVGPVAVLIAARSSARRVFAVDANPDAFRFLEENVRRNRVAVTPVLQDAREFLQAVREADRIVLDLPHGAAAFLEDSLRAVRPGGWIHLYEILETADRDDRVVALEQQGRAAGRPLTVTAVRSVHAYSSTQALLAFDLAVA